MQQVLVALACVLELVLDVCFGPHGCAKDGEPLFLGEQVLAAGPNLWAEGFQAWWCGATGVPDACFPTVELDVGVLEKFMGHEVVDCSNSIGLDDGVKIV